MHGQFITETTGKNVVMVIKIGAEALLCAAQEQPIRTNYMKYHIDKTSESLLCRLCGKKSESVQHITSGCEKWGEFTVKNTILYLHIFSQHTFFCLFVCFSSKNLSFVILISFFDEVSNFRKRILTNQNRNR